MAAGQGTAARQGVDQACAATCDEAFARDTKVVESTRYWLGRSGGGVCPTPWNTNVNECTTAFLSCIGKCGLYDEACSAPCVAPVQACCQANARTNATHSLEVCLAACPKAAPEAPNRMSASPRLPVERTPGREVAGPAGADDDWRRTQALDSVQASLREMDGAFAVVSGGQGRLWIVKRNGERLKLADDLAAWLRTVERGWKSPAEKAAVSAASDVAYEKLRALGFAQEDAAHIVDSVALSHGFAAGEVFYFPPNGGWPAQMLKYKASSEHSTIRGTINGGGDFI